MEYIILVIVVLIGVGIGIYSNQRTKNLVARFEAATDEDASTWSVSDLKRVEKFAKARAKRDDEAGHHYRALMPRIVAAIGDQ